MGATKEGRKENSWLLERRMKMRRRQQQHSNNKNKNPKEKRRKSEREKLKKSDEEFSSPGLPVTNQSTESRTGDATTTSRHHSLECLLPVLLLSLCIFVASPTQLLIP